jgi:tetratricopeptide (TPR) repeat protein
MAGLTPRLRVSLLVAAAAVAVAAIAVGVTLATRSDVASRRSTPPPFAADPTASPAVAGDVRTALEAWPSGTVRRLRILAAQHPGTALVRLELGLALAFSRDPAAAESAWRAAKRVQPDSPSAVRADDLLHPNTPPGKPPFVPSFTRPANRVEQLLAEGVGFQQALRPVSAERAFEAAAAIAADNPEAQVAAAVGLYDKDHPERAFGRLGPLTRRFPRAQTVRFHLGLLLIYLGQVPQARRELRLAVAEGPRTQLANRARVLLKASRTGRQGRNK